MFLIYLEEHVILTSIRSLGEEQASTGEKKMVCANPLTMFNRLLVSGLFFVLNSLSWTPFAETPLLRLHAPCANTGRCLASPASAAETGLKNRSDQPHDSASPLVAAAMNLVSKPERVSSLYTQENWVALVNALFNPDLNEHDRIKIAKAILSLRKHSSRFRLDPELFTNATFAETWRSSFLDMSFIISQDEFDALLSAFTSSLEMESRVQGNEKEGAEQRSRMLFDAVYRFYFDQPTLALSPSQFETLWATYDMTEWLLLYQPDLSLQKILSVFRNPEDDPEGTQLAKSALFRALTSGGERERDRVVSLSNRLLDWVDRRTTPNSLREAILNYVSMSRRALISDSLVINRERFDFLFTELQNSNNSPKSREYLAKALAEIGPRLDAAAIDIGQRRALAKELAHRDNTARTLSSLAKLLGAKQSNDLTVEVFVTDQLFAALEHTSAVDAPLTQTAIASAIAAQSRSFAFTTELTDRLFAALAPQLVRLEEFQLVIANAISMQIMFFAFAIDQPRFEMLVRLEIADAPGRAFLQANLREAFPLFLRVLSDSSFSESRERILAILRSEIQETPQEMLGVLKDAFQNSKINATSLEALIVDDPGRTLLRTNPRETFPLFLGVLNDPSSQESKRVLATLHSAVQAAPQEMRVVLLDLFQDPETTDRSLGILSVIIQTALPSDQHHLFLQGLLRDSRILSAAL